MKRILIILALFISTVSFSQIGKTLEENLQPLLEGFKEGKIDKATIMAEIKKVVDNPDLYNDVWQQFLSQITSKNDKAWKLLNDLNIKFKTFQSVNNSNSSLGFSYNFNYNYTNAIKKENSQISNTISLKFNGNVAFDRIANPNDFLDASINYSFSRFTGGVATANSTEDATKLTNIAIKLASITDLSSPEAIALFQERNQYLKYSDQYYFAINPRFSLESNQDFSKKQFVYGGDLQLGAKAWNDDSVLAKLNFLDYPFALVRMMTGIDEEFTPYGSTFPTALIGVDYVNPVNDTQRQAIVGNLNSFERLNIESSFKTFVTKVQSENVFFSANVRYYKEIDASALIKAANLDEHFYFVMALESSTGFYVSYAKGKLPFDVISDEVYAIGFNYKL
jgi:hypothetical protein